MSTNTSVNLPEFVTVQNFINGEFVDPVHGKYVDIVTPATGKVYGKLPDSSVEDIDAAVKAAKAAFKKWSKTPRADRSKILNKIADLIESRLMEFAEAESVRIQNLLTTIARSRKTCVFSSYRRYSKVYFKLIYSFRVVSNFRFFAGAILHHEESSSEIDNVATNYTYRYQKLSRGDLS
jgi:hypothetical protein